MKPDSLRNPVSKCHRDTDSLMLLRRIVTDVTHVSARWPDMHVGGC